MRSDPFLGFVLLTHQKPKQILRLIDRLNFMFDRPPIVCHHDFSQCSLPMDLIPRNVSFVRPHIKTAWGEWSLVKATLKGIEQLYSMHNPDWFIFLSGSDYPIKPAQKILNELKTSQFDAHISSDKLVKEEIETDKDEAFYLRYHSLTFNYPSIFHVVQSIREREWVRDKVRVKNPKYIRYVLPFSEDFRCYKGSQWFTANRKAAQYILRFDASNWRVKFFYKRVPCADESYFHTILNNADELKICTSNWRYTDWTGMKSHPRELDLNDLPKMIESDNHFARKFNLQKNPEVLNRLDEIIEYKTETQDKRVD